MVGRPQGHEGGSAIHSVTSGKGPSPRSLPVLAPDPTQVDSRCSQQGWTQAPCTHVAPAVMLSSWMALTSLTFLQGWVGSPLFGG